MAKTGTALHEDETGQMLADRTLAQGLIEYGLRNEKPEAIAVGVRMLRAIPVQAIDRCAKKQSTEVLLEMLDLAAKMRGCDDATSLLIEKARNTRTSTKLREQTKPNLWVVDLKIDESYRLEPLRFAASMVACVTATADSPGQLSITVRGERQKKHGSSKPSPNSYCWETGTRVREWFVTVKNVSYSAKRVTIESNSSR